MGDLEKQLAEDVGEPNGEAKGPKPKGPILVETARSSRSTCRCCKSKIEKEAPRCGLDVKVRSRWETRWCHAKCFLSTCFQLTHYQGSKATCRGSGTAISKGDPIV